MTDGIMRSALMSSYIEKPVENVVLAGHWLSGSEVRVTVVSKHFWDNGCQRAGLGRQLAASTFGTKVVNKHFWDYGCQKALLGQGL